MNEELKEVEEKIVELYEKNVNGVFNEAKKEILLSLEFSKRKMLD
jgi:hypothetical protein